MRNNQRSSSAEQISIIILQLQPSLRIHEKTAASQQQRRTNNKQSQTVSRPDQTRPGDDRDDELREVLEEHVREELPAEPDVLEPAQRVALFFWPFGDRDQDRARSEERATTYCCGGSTNVRGGCGEERVVPGKNLGLSGTYSDTGFKVVPRHGEILRREPLCARTSRVDVFAGVIARLSGRPSPVLNRFVFDNNKQQLLTSIQLAQCGSHKREQTFPKTPKNTTCEQSTE